MKSKIELKESENLYALESWLDINGKPCYPGAVIEYENDAINNLSGRNIKLYSKITQSEYGWWGALSAREWVCNKNSRPNPIWTFTINKDRFRILEGEESNLVWDREIKDAKLSKLRGD